jgi:dolichol kinase
MPKKKKYDWGTFWFLAIIVVAIIGSFPGLVFYESIIWLILGICGAMIAIQNIQIKEEKSFLIGITALFVIIIAFSVIPHFNRIAISLFGKFLVNLAVAFGIAGFVVSLGLVSRVGMEK